MNSKIQKSIEDFLTNYSIIPDQNLNYNDIMQSLLEKFQNKFTHINKLLLDTCTNYFFQQSFFKNLIKEPFSFKEEKEKWENHKLKSYQLTLRFYLTRLSTEDKLNKFVEFLFQYYLDPSKFAQANKHISKTFNLFTTPKNKIFSVLILRLLLQDKIEYNQISFAGLWNQLAKPEQKIKLQKHTRTQFREQKRSKQPNSPSQPFEEESNKSSEKKEVISQPADQIQQHMPFLPLVPSNVEQQKLEFQINQQQNWLFLQYLHMTNQYQHQFFQWFQNYALTSLAQDLYQNYQNLSLQQGQAPTQIQKKESNTIPCDPGAQNVQ